MEKLVYPKGMIRSEIMFKHREINQEKLLMLIVCFYVLMFALSYPPFHTTIDEQSHLRVAYLLVKKGSFTIDNRLNSYGFVFNGREYISNYPIGQSLLLIPFIILGWKTAYSSGLLILLLGSFVFYKILKRQGEETYNVLLYLLFPYFIYFSTTLYRDFSSALFIISAFYFYTSKNRKDHFISGVFFGSACLIRYTNLIAFLPFASVSLLKNRTRLKYLLLGFAPFAIIILGYNHIFFGSIFTAQAKSYAQGAILQKAIPLSTFSARNYRYYIPFISFRLLIIYPLMLFAPFFYKKEGRTEILLTILAFFLFFGARVQSGWGYGIGPSTLTRYFIPIMPLFLITYIPFYQKIVEKARLPPKPLITLAIFILFVGSIFILYGQHKYLSQQYSVSNEIYSNTNDNSLIISHVGISRYMLDPFGDRRFIARGKVENISEFFDDNTYIVYKEGDANLNIAIENMIKKYSSQLELIYSNQYQSSSGISRPFKLEIYRVKISSD